MVSLLCSLTAIHQLLSMLLQVASLDTAELLAGGWQDGCLLLVMPGGADLPYCKHLNGRGNALIRGARRLRSGSRCCCCCRWCPLLQGGGRGDGPLEQRCWKMSRLTCLGAAANALPHSCCRLC